MVYKKGLGLHPTANYVAKGRWEVKFLPSSLKVQMDIYNVYGWESLERHKSTALVYASRLKI